jgi:hypothetical protein
LDGILYKLLKNIYFYYICSNNKLDDNNKKKEKELVWINSTSSYYDMYREEVGRIKWSQIFLIKKNTEIIKICF